MEIVSSSGPVPIMEVGAVGTYDSEEPNMQAVTTIGLDIAKSVFQIHYERRPPTARITCHRPGSPVVPEFTTGLELNKIAIGWRQPPSSALERRIA
jgi:hypothetical protein